MLQDYWEPILVKVGRARNVQEDAKEEVLAGAGVAAGERSAVRSAAKAGATVARDLAATWSAAATTRMGSIGSANRSDEDEADRTESDHYKYADFRKTVPVSRVKVPRQRRIKPGRVAFLKRNVLYLIPIVAIVGLVGVGGLAILGGGNGEQQVDKPITLPNEVSLAVKPKSANAESMQEASEANETTAPPAVPTPLPDKMQVTDGGSAGVWLRPEPSEAAKGIEAKADGTVMEVLGQEAEVDGQVWLLLKDDRGNVGWMPAANLAVLASADPVEPARASEESVTEPIVASQESEPTDTGADAATTSAAANAGGSGVPGSAAVEFWLRADANQGARKIAIIQSGSQITLLNSKAGEVLNSNGPSPSKWYEVQTTEGETGWAYSDWVRRAD